MRRVTGILALVLVSSVVGVIVGLATLELAIRQGWVRWDLPPFNPYGPKPRGTFRVLVLGDSFSRLYPEDYNFGNRLERQLASRDVETLNLAWSGYGPLESLNALAREGRRFAPDLILLGYYVGNDLTDTITRTRGRSIGQLIAEAQRPPEGWDELVSRLPSLAFAANRWQRLVPRLPSLVLASAEHPVTASAPQPLPDPAATARDARPLNPSWYAVRRNMPDFHRVNLLLTGDGEGGWQANKTILSWLHADAKVLAARLVVLAFPSTLQVDTTHHAFFAKLGIDVDPAFLETRRPQALLEELCAAEGIPFLDLLPAFRRHAGEALYWNRDDHLNGAGNTLAFEETWRFLETTGLLPGPGRRDGER